MGELHAFVSFESCKNVPVNHRIALLIAVVAITIALYLGPRRLPPPRRETL